MTRNPFCRQYGRCLAEAAIRNDKDLPCHQCEFRTDRSARPGLDDLPGVLCLLAAIFSPDGLPTDTREARAMVEADLSNIIARLAGSHVRAWEYEYRISV